MALNLTRTDVKKISDAGYVMPVLHPITEEDTGATITVLGVKSPKVVEWMRARLKDEKKKQNLKEKEAAKKGKKNQEEDEDINFEELDCTFAEFAAARVIAWSGITVDDAEGNEVELECTPENVLEQMKTHEFLRTQVLEASGNLKLFLKS